MLKDATSQERSFEDESAVIHSDSLRMSYGGSVACKSPCCYYDRYTLKYSEGEERRGEQLLGHEQGKHGHIEIFTYSQTDFLALSA